MREIRTSGLMSGDGKRGNATAPVLDSTRMAGIRKLAWYNYLEPLRDWLSTPLPSPDRICHARRR
jgi:hypothetical protein